MKNKMDKMTISMCVSGDCNLRCRYCIAEVSRHRDPDYVFDFDAALAWCQKFYPGCNVHFGGGEPLMIPDLHVHVQKFLDAGHAVTIFTNTTLIDDHQELQKMDVNWQCSHHISQNISYEQFFANIAPLPKDRVVCVRVMYDHEAERDPDGVKKVYAEAGYDFYFLEFKGGYIGYENQNNFEKHPNKRMLMLLWDNVHNCSNPNEKIGPIIGSISGLTLDESNFETFECPKCTWPDGCQACQSADIFHEMNKRKGKYK